MKTFDHPLDPRDEKCIGLYEKFRVERTDGSSGEGRKHADCEYFVLDLTHDRHAYAALTAYAQSCSEDFPALANDLLERATAIAKREPLRGPRTREEVIAEHERLAACWSNRCGRPDWGANHTARAEAVRNGAGLTEAELTGNDYGIMHETLARSPDGDTEETA
jgi:hypothetical protein